MIVKTHPNLGFIALIFFAWLRRGYREWESGFVHIHTTNLSRQMACNTDCKKEVGHTEQGNRNIILNTTLHECCHSLMLSIWGVCQGDRQ